MTLRWESRLVEEQVPAGNLFLEDPWLEAYARHQPDGPIDVHSLTVGQDRIVLGRRREKQRGFSARVLRFLGDPLADQFWFGDETCPDWATMIAGIDKAPRWDVAVLSELNLSEKTRNDICRIAFDHGLKTHWRLCGKAPVVYLERDSKPLDFGDYSSTLRRRLKRSRKKLEAAGKVEVFHHLPKPEGVAPLINVMKSIEDASWKGSEGSGLFSDKRLPFIRDLSLALAARQQLEIYILELDGQPISYRYGFRYNNRFLDYNLAYRQEYSQLSPGRILLDEIITTSQKLGLEAVDASRGSLVRPHILADWPCEIREHYRLTLFNRSLVGRALYQIETRIRPMVLSLKNRKKT